MKLQSCYDSLEKINEEYIYLQSSSEMRIGKTIKVIMSLNLKRIFTCIKMAFKAKNKKNGKMYFHPYFYSKGEPLEDDKKVVVYCCVTGGYDVLQAPLLYDDSLDYYAISDRSIIPNVVWKYMNLPSLASQLKGGMVNRFCKLNPFMIFPEYDFSIYIDGNIDIVSDVRNLCSIARKSRVGIAMHLHDRRDCVYDESLVCKLYKRGNMDAIDKQMEKYRDDHFPKHFGLMEASIIIVDLSNKIALKIMQDWWNELLRSGSERDQLSFPYVLWKNGYQINDVGCLGNNRRKNPKFRTRLHFSEFRGE